MNECEYYTEKANSGDSGFHVIPMRDAEAVEVVNCIYQAYGDSYGHEFLYSPNQIVDLVKTGHLDVCVAVSQKDEVAGCGALVKQEDWPEIVELAHGAVKPEFRRRGLFHQIEQYRLSKARQQGYRGAFVRIVTAHPYSQIAAHKAGLEAIALRLCVVPPTLEIKGITKKSDVRENTVMCFKYLMPPSQIAIYPPVEHNKMIRKIYRKIKQNPIVKTIHTRQPRFQHRNTVLRVKTSQIQALSQIEVLQYGNDAVSKVRRTLDSLIQMKIGIVHLLLNLCDPMTSLLTEEFQALGFFFSGILPGTGSGDTLILQFLHDLTAGYDKIRLESSMAREILEYVKQLDPTRQTFEHVAPE